MILFLRRGEYSVRVSASGFNEEVPPSEKVDEYVRAAQKKVRAPLHVTRRSRAAVVR